LAIINFTHRAGAGNKKGRTPGRFVLTACHFGGFIRDKAFPDQAARSIFCTTHTTDCSNTEKAQIMRNTKGQVLVETALILPLLLVLIFGLVDFGRAMYTKNTLNYAASLGARVAAVTPSLTEKTFTPSSTGEPADTINNCLSTLKLTSAVSYQLKILDAANNSTGKAAVPGDRVYILITWPDFPMLTPLYKLLSLLDGSTPQDTNTLEITGEASMRYE
jgi:Flp pilus assembly protein TadG